MRFGTVETKKERVDTERENRIKVSFSYDSDAEEGETEFYGSQKEIFSGIIHLILQFCHSFDVNPIEVLARIFIFLESEEGGVRK